MLHFSRWAAIVGAPVTVFVLLAGVTPTEARGISNGIQLNGIAVNGVGNNALVTTDSALGDLNGVAVEALIIPEAAIH